MENLSALSARLVVSALTNISISPAGMAASAPRMIRNWQDDWRRAGRQMLQPREGERIREAYFLAGNYRMTELQGAAALAQLKKLDAIVERRNKWIGGFNDALKDLKGISLNQVPPGSYPTWWHYMLRVKHRS